jgi:hypothetical protein
MRAVTHVAAGAVIVANISNPWISLPLAVVAHFVLDTLPHYGDVKSHRAQQLAKQRYEVPLDALAGLLVLLAVIVWYPVNPLLVALGGVLCASPDLWHIYPFVRYLRTGDSSVPADWLSKFHDRIQWCERRWGLAVELPLLAILIYILFANA